MAASSDSYHEPYELLDPETRDMHRAVVSAMEELEAIDWYQQRADAVGDDELRAILLHNKHEEIEHACMTLEWIRRRNPDFDRLARRYLFTEGPIPEIEEAEEGAAEDAGTDGSLGIGALRSSS